MAVMPIIPVNREAEAGGWQVQASPPSKARVRPSCPVLHHRRVLAELQRPRDAHTEAPVPPLCTHSPDYSPSHPCHQRLCRSEKARAFHFRVRYALGEPDMRHLP